MAEPCKFCGVSDALQWPNVTLSRKSALPPATEGRKDDSGKARYDLTPPEVEEAIAKVRAYGAAKYGDRNWERGMNWGRPYAALRRHMAAWWSGEATTRRLACRTSTMPPATSLS